MNNNPFPWEVKEDQRQRSDYDDYREACDAALVDEHENTRSALAEYEWLY